MSSSDEKTLHLVGIGVGHSIAPPMHNAIARSLSLWTFHATECNTIKDLLLLARKDSTAGLVVTMPYKNTVMPRLDALDPLSTTIGACNNVYRNPSNPARLRGTNTDWLGVKGCLLEKGDGQGPVDGRPALIASVIYVLNRDDGEVVGLQQDAQWLSPTPKIVHVKEGESKTLEMPYYVVGTVPDLEPTSASELAVRPSLEDFLSRPEKGVLLDMCFKPRRTRMIKSAESLGWPSVEGTHVIGYQIEEQWKLWAGEERVKKLDKDAAWRVLLEAADNSPGINF
ncbi:shikimate dehydrogenase [Colletotrichum salicis]|uniref:Shikimate dehydrogenase n=1 Tax=Colletotrichum salicis TaxID=1209931 RepID=A0A135V6L3_9PEZI|nr:shikimate dehydrogenase [Colletotrichum salicis]